MGRCTMQIRNPVACDAGKFAYKSNKPRLVVEHAFPLMGLIGLSANITFCGSGGIMSTARTVALPMYFPGQFSVRDFSEGKGI